MCKNLFLKDTRSGSLWLVVARVETEVKLSSLTKKLKLRTLRFAGEDILNEVLQVRQGSVTPLALINDRGVSNNDGEATSSTHKVRVIIDKAIFDSLEPKEDDQEKSILVHPLSNDFTTEVRLDEFKSFLKACGHDVQVFDFADLT